MGERRGGRVLEWSKCLFLQELACLGDPFSGHGNVLLEQLFLWTFSSCRALTQGSSAYWAPAGWLGPLSICSVICVSLFSLPHRHWSRNMSLGWKILYFLWSCSGITQNPVAYVGRSIAKGNMHFKLSRYCQVVTQRGYRISWRCKNVYPSHQQYNMHHETCLYLPNCWEVWSYNSQIWVGRVIHSLLMEIVFL